MKKPFITFLYRGMLFGGFGPIVAGVVYYILSLTVEDISLTGGQVLAAILSTYLLAFVQAGSSVFNQMEHWPIMKTLLCHFSLLYVVYVSCYLLNSWIPFDWRVVLIFTAIFVVAYLVIWVTVYTLVKSTGRKMNRQLGH